jgi:hypothetical protein
MKPTGYLHTVRDAPLELLVELRAQMRLFLAEKLGGGMPEMWCVHCAASVRAASCLIGCRFNYPTAPIKSTLHLQISLNYDEKENEGEINRRMTLDQAVAGLALRRSLWWYQLHPRAKAYQLVRAAPMVPRPDLGRGVYEVGRLPLQPRTDSPLEALLDFPAADAGSHTMAGALDTYVTQRIPAAAVRAVLAGAALELHGVPAAVLAQLLAADGLYTEALPLPYDARARGTCSRRPAFVLCAARRVVYVAVMSGSDYLLHYASLLRHAVLQAASTTAAAAAALGRLRVVRYPEMERQLCAWTAFDGCVQPGDVVVYGYSDEVLRALRQRAGPGLRPVSAFASEYHESQRFELLCAGARRTVAFYACREHGWGSLSAATMGRAAAQRVAEVLYVAKGATCESPAHVYTVYCPSRFVFVAYDCVVAECAPPNGLVAARPELDTGAHASGRCILEQDYRMRAVLAAAGARSLDLEAGQIALAVQQHGGGRVGFSTLQFATDYLRHEAERGLHVEFDLANNREPPAERRRAAALQHMCDTVADYLMRPVTSVARL